MPASTTIPIPEYLLVETIELSSDESDTDDSSDSPHTAPRPPLSPSPPPRPSCLNLYRLTPTDDGLSSDSGEEIELVHTQGEIDEESSNEEDDDDEAYGLSRTLRRQDADRTEANLSKMMADPNSNEFKCWTYCEDRRVFFIERWGESRIKEPTDEDYRAFRKLPTWNIDDDPDAWELNSCVFAYACESRPKDYRNTHISDDSRGRELRHIPWSPWTHLEINA